MKAASTVRRELKRLLGMRQRQELTDEARVALDRNILTLRWVLDGAAGRGPHWRAPSHRIPGMDCRKGAP